MKLAVRITASPTENKDNASPIFIWYKKCVDRKILEGMDYHGRSESDKNPSNFFSSNLTDEELSTLLPTKAIVHMSEPIPSIVVYLTRVS